MNTQNNSYLSSPEEDKPSLSQYYQKDLKNKKIFFHFNLNNLKNYFSPLEYDIFKATYGYIIIELVNFFGYSLPVTKHSPEEILMIIYPKNPVEILDVEKIWKYFEIIYQQISKHGFTTDDIYNNNVVTTLLQEYLLETQAVKNDTQSKYMNKF